MSGLESLGLLGLFLGTFLAATVVPFSSDALYVAILLATKQPVSCLIVGTLGNWLGGITTYWIGRIGRWEWTGVDLAGRMGFRRDIRVFGLLISVLPARVREFAFVAVFLSHIILVLNHLCQPFQVLNHL